MLKFHVDSSGSIKEGEMLLVTLTGKQIGPLHNEWLESSNVSEADIQLKSGHSSNLASFYSLKGEGIGIDSPLCLGSNICAKRKSPPLMQ